MKRALLTVAIGASLLALVGAYAWVKSKQAEIQRISERRGVLMRQIEARLLEREPGSQILDKELESYCGRVIYKIEYVDATGVERKLYSDIEEGKAVDPAWLRDCLKLPADGGS